MFGGTAAVRDSSGSCAIWACSDITVPQATRAPAMSLSLRWNMAIPLLNFDR